MDNDYNDREMFAWDVYFANIVAIRLHPRNDAQDPYDIISFAAHIADKMIDCRRQRCQHG